MSDSYFFIDNEGDLWESSDGESFQCWFPDNPWHRCSSSHLVNQELNHVMTEHGVMDDGVTTNVRITAQPFITKDSGERARFESGMQRDTEAGKARFDLLLPNDVPYADQFLTRCADLMGRGAEKYDDRNWEKADSHAELARMKSSAIRHFMQWMNGETDEDHAAAVFFNLLAHETTQHKINQSTTNGEAA